MTSESLKQTMHPYQLEFSRCSVWLQDAKKLWVQHPVFFVLLAALVFGLRRVLDSMAMDFFIVLSYLTDAWIFAWIALGFARGHEGSAWSGIRSGWQQLKGRFFAVVKTVFWGIPSALVSFLIFWLAPEGVQALVVLQGNVFIATIMLFVILVAGGFMSMLLALLPVLAAIQMARDSKATLMSSGLWAYRGLRAGIFPLSILFMLFLFGAVVSNTVTTWLLGHLPIEAFSEWTMDEVFGILYGAPLTIYLMMNAFLALIPGMSADLLRSADTDLSDEIFSDTDKVTHGGAFGIQLLELAGKGLRGVAILAVVFLVIYASFSGYEEAGTWFVFAMAAYVWAGSFLKSAKAWREGQSWHRRYRFVITPIVMLVLLVVFAVIFDDEQP